MSSSQTFQARILEITKRVLIYAATYAIWMAAWLGLLHWLDKAPSVALITIGSIAAILIYFATNIANKLFVTRWVWDNFASQFPRGGVSTAGVLADGVGIVGRRYFPLKAGATQDGVFVQSAIYQTRPTAVIPWADISRIKVGVAAKLRGKPCKPFVFAHLYAQRAPGGQAIIPWRNEFETLVPKQVGLDRFDGKRAF